MIGLAREYHRTKAPSSSLSADQEGKKTYEKCLENLIRPPARVAWVDKKKLYLDEGIDKARREQQKTGGKEGKRETKKDGKGEETIA